MASANKQRKVDFENRLFQDSWTENYLFVLSPSGNKPVCLLCNESIAVVKQSNIKRHFEKKHATFNEQFPIASQIRKDKVTSLKSNVARSQLVLVRSMTKQEKAMEASLRVTWLIAKKKKPFTDAELVKDCVLAVVESVCDEKDKPGLTAAVKEIPLSDTTAGRRVDILGEKSFDILRASIQKSTKFSIALDESTDKADVAQLAVYVRYLNENIFAEELLCLLPLVGHTGAQDVYTVLTEFLERHDIDRQRIVSLATDGAPSMIGRVNGLAKRLTDDIPNLVTFHCIIHQSVLCARLSGELADAMTTIMKLVNFLRSTSSLQHRLFKAFLSEVDAEYDDLLVHNDVRWLSKGKVLQRFWILKEEVHQYLQTLSSEKAAGFADKLNNENFMQIVAFLCDIFQYLNDLNVKLQGRKHNVADLIENISAFRSKLVLFHTDISSRKLLHFSTMKAAVGHALPSVDLSVMTSFIEQLMTNFEERFDNFKIKKEVLVLLRNPFHVDIAGDIAHEVAVATCFNFINESEFQLQLVDLQNDEALKAGFSMSSDAEDFWIVQAVRYPIVREVALTLLTMFGSTYVCESSFSTMNLIKNRQRMRLGDKRLEHSLRIATTACVPDFKKLAQDRTCNFSH
jgi:hypothetical protein